MPSAVDIQGGNNNAIRGIIHTLDHNNPSNELMQESRHEVLRLGAGLPPFFLSLVEEIMRTLHLEDAW